MITTPDGEKIASDEEALAFMFAAYASVDGTEGIFSIPQPHRHRLIDKALHQIVTQLEGALSIPWVQGKFYGSGATVIYLDKPDFSEHVKLYAPNSFGVLDVQVEKNQDDGNMVYTGFGVYVRLGESNTWLSIGIKPQNFKEKSLFDFDNAEQHHDSEGRDDDDTSDDDDVYFREDDLLGSPNFYERNTAIISDIAAQVAVADGFGAVALRPELRKQFAVKFVNPRMDDFDVRDPFISEEQIADAVAHRARDYWEVYVIPMRARPLSEGGSKSPAHIAKALGITKNRAERAIGMPAMWSDANSDYIIPLLLKYDPVMQVPPHG